MRVGRRISMLALNNNIDGDLIFSGGFSRIFGDRVLALYGGNDVGSGIERSSCITVCQHMILPPEEPEIRFYTPNVAEDAYDIAMVIHPAMNARGVHVQLLNCPIANVADPTLVQDAATKNYVDTTLGLGTQGDLTVSAPVAISDATRHLIGGTAAISLVNDAAATITQFDTAALSNLDTDVPTSKAVTTALAVKPTQVDWANWTPSLVWGTANPTISGQTARWMQIGKTVYFALIIIITDGKGATSLTISTPSTPVNVSLHTWTPASHQKVDTTHYVPHAYVAYNSAFIVFSDFKVCTDTKAASINVSGFYEVA